MGFTPDNYIFLQVSRYFSKNPCFTYPIIIANHKTYQIICFPFLCFHIWHTCISGHSKPQHSMKKYFQLLFNIFLYLLPELPWWYIPKECWKRLHSWVLHLTIASTYKSLGPFLKVHILHIL